MKLKQSIGNYENQLKEVDRGIEEYNQTHDELKLEEIEYEIYFLLSSHTHRLIEAMMTTRKRRRNRKVGNTIQPWTKIKRWNRSKLNQKERTNLAIKKSRPPRMNCLS